MNLEAQYGNLFASEMTAGASARIVKTPHRDAGGKVRRTKDEADRECYAIPA